MLAAFQHEEIVKQQAFNEQTTSWYLIYELIR